MPPSSPPARRGLVHGVLAYGLWGVAPAYWKLLAGFDAVRLIAHRAVWGLGAFALLVVASRQIGALRTALAKPRVVAVMALSGSLVAINWCVFVWAVTNDHILDASLGYFISPLVSVALATVVLRERLRRLQWLAVALAALAVGLLTWRAGHVPWIALALAFSFGLYGLVRKTARVDALVGSSIETILLAPIAAIYLLATSSQAVPGHSEVVAAALLVGTGVVTAIPLVLFASAARHLPLSTVGFLQYLTPTGQFFLAVLAYGEPLSHERLMLFGLIWIGLAVFSIDLWRARKEPR